MSLVFGVWVSPKNDSYVDTSFKCDYGGVGVAFATPSQGFDRFSDNPAPACGGGAGGKTCMPIFSECSTIRPEALAGFLS
jgi:hypothetical protein